MEKDEKQKQKQHFLSYLTDGLSIHAPNFPSAA